MSLSNSYVLFGGDVILYVEDGAIMLRTCDPHGDAVTLKAEEAATLSHLLRRLAETGPGDEPVRRGAAQVTVAELGAALAAFARDLEVGDWMARWVGRLRPKLRRLRAREAVATFAHVVQSEMDLRLEGAAASESGGSCSGSEGRTAARRRASMTAWRAIW